MGRSEIKETLEKQLQLLSELSSESTKCNSKTLKELTEAMRLLAETIIRISPNLP